MSITWARLEPRVRPDSPDGNLARAVKAAIHDPLWMLCRQWQLGEFQGEDAGSPVAVQAQVATTPLTRFKPNDGPAADFDGSEPLDVLVEREPVPLLTLRDRAEAGGRFLRMLARRGAVPPALRARLVSKYPLDRPDAIDSRPVDPDAASFHALMAPRTPDGEKLAVGLRRGDLRDDRHVMAVKDEWLAWYGAYVEKVPGGCWIPEQLEYRFTVAGRLDGEEVVLSAPEYTGGGLDSYHLERIVPARTLGTPRDRTEHHTRTVVPTPAAFPGMPVDRFWQIEEGRVNLPAIDAGPIDLARMLLVEFATVYGNDWWIVPVDVACGSLTKITALTCTTTFGDEIHVAPAPREGWRMFEIAGPPGEEAARPLLALLPALADRQQSEPIEEVLLFRDELANLAWGVEHAAESARGRRRLISPRRPETARPADALPFPSLAYVLTGTVPDNWFPLVPVHARGSTHRVLLRRGRVERFAGDGTALPPPKAEGRFLDGDNPRVVFPDEEVPRAGRRLQRVANHARWTGGRIVTWHSRRVRAGRGEGSSGLQFDVARDPNTTRGER
jgi:hypothetical protein